MQHKKDLVDRYGMDRAVKGLAEAIMATNEPIDYKKQCAHLQAALRHIITTAGHTNKEKACQQIIDYARTALGHCK
jgi:hypothetical protein